MGRSWYRSGLPFIAALTACGGGGGGSGADGPHGGPDATAHGDGGTSDAPTDGRIVNHYATTFDGDEAPLSEGGAWSHVGLDWRTAVKAGGIAYGTQTGADGYDDSYAILSGFSPDQSGSGVIQLNPAIDGSCSHEVEILLRWSDSAHNARGYECNLSFNGSYAQIVRWNGALGSFDYLGSGTYGGPIDGATLEAHIEGNLIIESVNGTEVARATDDTFADGNPGVGFFRRECGANSDYGFTSYTANATGP